MLRSAYRFTIQAELASLLEERSADRGRDRQVPGGMRVYAKLSDGVARTPAAGKEREFLEGIRFDGDSRTVADLLSSDAPSPEGHPGAPLLQRLAGAGAERSLRERVALEWLAQLRGSESDPEGRETPRIWVGVEGAIRTSGFWALLREDGLFSLDGRFTIATKDGALISVQLVGTADLTLAYGGIPGAEAYRSWLRGKVPVARSVPFNATLNFDAPSDPGEKAAFMAKRYRAASAHFWKYVRLTRGQFVAAGALGLTDRAHAEIGFAQAVELHCYELVGSTPG